MSLEWYKSLYFVCVLCIIPDNDEIPGKDETEKDNLPADKEDGDPEVPDEGDEEPKTQENEVSVSKPVWHWHFFYHKS